MTDEQKAIDAIRFIVVAMATPDHEPVIEGVFDNEASARDEAQRFAGQHTAREYGVYQFLGSARFAPNVEWRGASR